MLKPHAPALLTHTLCCPSTPVTSSPFLSTMAALVSVTTHSRASHLLSKVAKLEEVVPGLLHPVGPPVPQAVGLAQQDGVEAPRPRPLPGRQVVQSLNLQQQEFKTVIIVVMCMCCDACVNEACGCHDYCVVCVFGCNGSVR